MRFDERLVKEVTRVLFSLILRSLFFVRRFQSIFFFINLPYVVLRNFAIQRLIMNSSLNRLNVKALIDYRYGSPPLSPPPHTHTLPSPPPSQPTIAVYDKSINTVHTCQQYDTRSLTSILTLSRMTGGLWDQTDGAGKQHKLCWCKQFYL